MEQLQILFEQIKEAFVQAIDMAVSMEMTQGTIMFLGGIAGILICFLAILLSLAIFPGQRKRMLRKLGQDNA